MSAPGCPVIASDTAANPNPIPFWGSIGCQDSSRSTYSSTGGDPHVTATGAPQPDTAYRRLTVMDGDDVYGERCELGLNDHNSGPTTFYHEGDHRVTYFSERLPDNIPLDSGTWQTVMQMKQTEPSHDADTGPAIEMQLRDNEWVVEAHWHDLWTFPAQHNTWTRFAYDVHYSQSAAHGSIQVSADLNGDGDFDDPGERSPLIHDATLATEISGSFNSSDGLAAGAPIPSHLRIGVYHDPSIPCPAPTGCSNEIDNVQVVGA